MHEAAYMDNRLVTYSSSLQNLKEDLDDLISSLRTWQVNIGLVQPVWNFDTMNLSNVFDTTTCQSQ